MSGISRLVVQTVTTIAFVMISFYKQSGWNHYAFIEICDYDNLLVMVTIIRIFAISPT